MSVRCARIQPVCRICISPFWGQTRGVLSRLHDGVRYSQNGLLMLPVRSSETAVEDTLNAAAQVGLSVSYGTDEGQGIDSNVHTTTN